MKALSSQYPVLNAVGCRVLRPGNPDLCGIVPAEARDRVVSISFETNGDAIYSNITTLGPCTSHTNTSSETTDTPIESPTLATSKKPAGVIIGGSVAGVILLALVGAHPLKRCIQGMCSLL